MLAVEALAKPVHRLAEAPSTWIRVIGSDGKTIVKRRPLTHCPITPTKTCAVPEITPTVRLEEDGTPLLGVTCDGVGGFAKIDAYGQWIGRFREFRMKGGEDLKERIQGFARLPGDTRYLLHLKGQPDSLVVVNEPRPGYGVHQFGNLTPVARERSQTFSWSTGTALVLDRRDVGQNRYDVYARVLDKVSTPVKKEKVVLPACIPPVAAVRVNDGLLIVSSTATHKVFQYTLITR